MSITTNFKTGLLDLVTDMNTAQYAVLAEALYESTFGVGKITDFHRVVPNVREGRVVPIISTSPTYLSFPYKNPSDCETTECDLDLGFSAKKWEIGMIACKIPICLNTFDENFLLFWGEYKRLWGDHNLDGALMKFIFDKFQTELDASVWRTVWFGDRTVPSSDPNYKFLRVINGIFTQAESMDGIKIEISENTPVNGVIPAIGGEKVRLYLETAYREASKTAWFDESKLQFEMTKAMATELVIWLNSLDDKSKTNCECYDVDKVTALKTFSVNKNLFIFGIPIFVHQELDAVITALKLDRPYRALLTQKDNILIGTAEMDQLLDTKVWYSEDQEKVFMRGGSQIGATLVVKEYVYLGAEAGNTAVLTN